MYVYVFYVWVTPVLLLQGFKICYKKKELLTVIILSMSMHHRNINMFKDAVILDIRLLQDGHHCVCAMLNKWAVNSKQLSYNALHAICMTFSESFFIKYSSNYYSQTSENILQMLGRYNYPNISHMGHSE